MKKSTFENPHFRTILSILVLGFFLLIAAGSDDGIELLCRIYLEVHHEIEEETEKRKTSYHYSTNYRVIEREYVGEQNFRGRWSGQITITSKYQDQITGDTMIGVENVNMEDGLRHGRSTMIYPEAEKVIVDYTYGEPINKGDYFTTKKGSVTTSSGAFHCFSYRHPWYVFALELSGYDSLYLENYLDTLELILAENTFSPEAFDDNYENALEILEETPYDSIIKLSSFFTYLKGLNILCGNELRLATFDRFYGTEGSTFEILQETYPGYVEAMVQEAEIPKSGLGIFCDKLDSAMNSYGTLDPKNPFIVDSLDSQMYRGIMEIYESGEVAGEKAAGTIESILPEKPGPMRRLCQTILSEQGLNSSHSTPSEVAEVVLYTIFMSFLDGDLMKNAVHSAWLEQNGIASLPTATTSFFSHNSATSVTVAGYVPRDGGSEVSNRGITWGSTYNPTLANHAIASGMDTGFFKLDIKDLSEGESYYARSYATNSVGTSYGNCIQFIVMSTPTAIQKQLEEDRLCFYPNPASTVAWLECPASASGTGSLQIIDMSGRIVLEMETGQIETEHRLQLDVRELSSGNYICKLVMDNGLTCTSRLLIAH